MPATLHPTKEQVRAYMQLRECARHPPPMPEEIRRQLGWRYGSSGADLGAASTIFLPSTIAQLAALMAVEWCFLASGLSRHN
jgi:hypothetical protein